MEQGTVVSTPWCWRLLVKESVSISFIVHKLRLFLQKKKKKRSKQNNKNASEGIYNKDL